MKKKSPFRIGTMTLVLCSIVLFSSSVRGSEDSPGLFFPASPWTLESNASTAVTNEFDALKAELDAISRSLVGPGGKRHEMLDGLDKERQLMFVRSLYVGYLTKGPESPFGLGRVDDPPGAIVRNRRKWMRLHSDEEVAAGRLRNRMARAAFILFLKSSADSLPDVVQQGLFLASCSIWFDFDSMRNDGSNIQSRRREEDGILSAEAFLEWFAENENFCDSVRADAKARLESLEKNPAPKPDAQPVATIAAEGQEQDVATGEETE